MDQRYTALCARFEGLQTAAVAFSGGVDSGLLLTALRNTLGSERVLALTAVTPYMGRQDIGEAVDLATRLDVRHELLELPMPAGLENNPPDRCYRCKLAMGQCLIQCARGLGFLPLFEGSNLDDAGDDRPGLRALRELGIRSPLMEACIDKAGVRALARALDLPTWSRPDNACLLTRIGFNAPVSMERLQQIEEAERTLLARGYSQVRVRCHGDLARIEVAADERARLLEEATTVVADIRAQGFRHVTMDLVGYRFGSMSRLRA
ncbi:MAG: ATP-dependent sacrificial sulfur transferase LarE [Chromatiaceae bacterium]|nr:MAG: ATP-dependent sacrificial sulfur transferase LarE [Chromatiaceae bacterium]